MPNTQQEAINRRLLETKVPGGGLGTHILEAMLPDKRWLGKVKAFLSELNAPRTPAEAAVDIGTPVVAGTMSTSAAKELPVLLRKLYLHGSAPAERVVKGLVQEEIPVEVTIPRFEMVYRQIPGQRAVLASNVEAFLRTLADLPKGALSRVKTAVYNSPVDFLGRARYRTVSGAYFPSAQSLQVHVPPGTAVRTGAVRIPETVAHEATHAATTREDLLGDIVDYLRELGWKFEVPPEFSPQYIGRGYTPRTVGELYSTARPTEWPDVVPPTTWMKVRERGRYIPYGLISPMEDVAEAGSYAMLEAMPRMYTKRYAKQIDALRQNLRYEAIKRLLRAAGVDI